MRIYVASAIAVIAILASALIEADAETTPPTLARFKNPSLPPEERARDLISNMTLEEKAAQLGHTAPAIARLGIPEYNWWNEGLHGVARADVATVFPQAIGMAASWDVPLMHRVANVLGTEFRANNRRRSGRPDLPSRSGFAREQRLQGRGTFGQRGQHERGHPRGVGAVDLLVFGQQLIEKRPPPVRHRGQECRAALLGRGIDIDAGRQKEIDQRLMAGADGPHPRPVQSQARRFQARRCLLAGRGGRMREKTEVPSVAPR